MLRKAPIRAAAGSNSGVAFTCLGQMRWVFVCINNISSNLRSIRICSMRITGKLEETNQIQRPVKVNAIQDSICLNSYYSNRFSFQIITTIVTSTVTKLNPHVSKTHPLRFNPFHSTWTLRKYQTLMRTYSPSRYQNRLHCAFMNAASFHELLVLLWTVEIWSRGSTDPNFALASKRCKLLVHCGDTEFKKIPNHATTLIALRNVTLSLIRQMYLKNTTWPMSQTSANLLVVQA